MFQAAKGTKDILPAEISDWQFLEKKFFEVCQRFGYREIRVPTFENTELFQRGVGDTTDVVQKEMYTFMDKANRSMTLRPEITAGVVRAYLEHGLFNETAPQKFCYAQTAFRYEKMGKGRFREFNQFGCECFGSDNSAADIDLIALLDAYFAEIGLKSITLKINAIGCPECREKYLTELREYLRPNLPELCPDCQNRFERNPMRSLDCKVEKCGKIIVDAPVPADCLCEQCQQHFQSVCRGLDALSIKYEIDNHIVRGLDYYTRTVFEFVSNNVGTQGTICGGGRYDNLVAEIGSKNVPAVGFAMGIERLLLEVKAQNLQLTSTLHPHLQIVYFPSTRDYAHKLANNLRRLGKYVEIDVCDRSFKAQMKYANKTGARYVLVIGDDERKNGMASLKRMSDGREQQCNLIDCTEIVQNLEE